MIRLRLALLGLIAYFLSLTLATALTYKLVANEKACFFTQVDQQGAKIAFYFAVQSGGSFDVDYTVTGPNGKIIMENSKERQLDSVFTAKETGEYTFCFNNEMSTFAEKMVDFEIAVRGPLISPELASPPLIPNDLRYPSTNVGVAIMSKTHPLTCPLSTQVENETPSALLPSKQGTSPEQTSALEESIMKVSRDLSTINRNQKYFRTRENRNFSTVKSTESRIFNFSVVESGLMVCMAGLQVFIVRFFFQGARKGYV